MRDHGVREFPDHRLHNPTRLRELEADGLVWREQENTIPPKVTYGLTETGLAVHAVLKSLERIKV